MSLDDAIERLSPTATTATNGSASISACWPSCLPSAALAAATPPRTPPAPTSRRPTPGRSSRPRTSAAARSRWPPTSLSCCRPPSPTCRPTAAHQGSMPRSRTIATRSRSSPPTRTRKEGLDELFVKGKALEAERDVALRKDPYFDWSQALLQIAIVLASVHLIIGNFVAARPERRLGRARRPAHAERLHAGRETAVSGLGSAVS